MDLNNFSCHQAYYTALLQSASAAETLILQGFDPKIITCGASAALRQDFRSLEILDEITLLWFNSNLPSYMGGYIRKDLVKSFRKWNGKSYMPSIIHSAIRWNKKNSFLEDDIEDLTADKLLGKLPNDNGESDKISSKIARSMHSAKVNQNDEIDTMTAPSTPLYTKRKALNDNESMMKVTSKRCKHNSPQSPTVNLLMCCDGIPKCLRNSNNSCGYDAVITIVYNLWVES